jgi:predicted acyltransferase (DUF342 family)
MSFFYGDVKTDELKTSNGLELQGGTNNSYALTLDTNPGLNTNYKLNFPTAVGSADQYLKISDINGTTANLAFATVVAGSSSVTLSNITAGNAESNLTTTTGSITIYPQDSNISLKANNNITIHPTTQSSSTSTGALIVNGGIGVAKNTYIGGNLSIADDVSAGANVDVTGNVNVTKNVDITGTLTVDTTSTLTGDVSAGANVDVTGNVNVIKNVDITGTLTVDTTSTLTGDVSAGANIDVTGNVNVTKNVDITGTLTVDTTSTLTGDVSAGANVDVTGNVVVSKGLIVTEDITASSNVDVSGNVVVSKNIIVGGDLTVNGTTTTVNSTVTTIDDPVIELGNASITSIDTKDRGLVLNVYDGANNQTQFIGWDRNKDVFAYYSNVTVSPSDTMTINTIGDAEFAVITANSTASSTSTTTGSLIAKGGVGIAGDVFTGSNINVSGNVVVSKGLIVTEDITASSNVDVSGNVNVTKNVDITGTLIVDSTANIGGNSNITGSLDITGATTIYDDLTVEGDLNTSNTFSLVQGSITVSGTGTEVLDFSQRSDFIISVSGTSTLTLASKNVNTVGQQGSIIITQTADTNSLSWQTSNGWYFPSATAPTLSSGTGNYDIFSYLVVASGGSKKILVMDATNFQAY